LRPVSDSGFQPTKRRRAQAVAAQAPIKRDSAARAQGYDGYRTDSAVFFFL
jgi:hypothetical protein